MAVVTEKRKLLWVGPGGMAPNVRSAVAGGWDVVACATPEAMARHLDAAAVLVTPSANVDPRRLSAVLDRIDRSGVVGVVLLPAERADDPALVRRRGQFIFADADAAPAELAARLDAAAALQPAIRNLHADVAAVRGFGSGVAHDLAEVDEEMRLAARLQRDFLPKSLPRVGPVRFATMFRPASWVSGDIYDVSRLDETHVGFYIADVVGHGMPAALLTMFIKKSLQTKRIVGHDYEIVPPGEVLAQLNADICEQNLTSCQFCTAVYAVVDTAALTLRYARGGHPAPILLGPDGTARRLDTGGALLGILPQEAYPADELPLRPHQRLVAFSDGAEDAFTRPGGHDGPALLAELQALRHVEPEEMILRLTARIDEHRAVNGRDDDVTVIVMDVADAPPA